MLSYKEYEKQVFDWLNQKHKLDNNFTFSVRMKGSKGTELDYFIGTKKSNYFGTTFWSLPVAFPGSSADCIGLIFGVNEEGYGYYFQFTQTNSPNGVKNISALNLIKSLKSELTNKLGLSYESKQDNKMFAIRTKSRNDRYTSLDEMLSDIFLDLNIIFPLVNKYIQIEKEHNPEFKAERISKNDYDSMIERMNKRFKKYSKQKELKNYKEEFKAWLNKDSIEGSGKTNSYVRAIELLEDPCGYDVFVVNEINKVDTLLIDLKENEKDEKSKYFNAQAKSYGQKGFYSAAIKKYLEFLQLRNDSPEDMNNNNQQNKASKNELNQILFGPPGTGKTYNSINHAVAIIEDKSVDEIQEENRNDVLNRYKGYVSNGQIVFTTFHQNMSYEDFVEGIKPVEPENEGDNLIYRVELGIFRKLCIDAGYDIAKNTESKLTEKTLNFSQRYDNFLDETEAKIEKDEEVVIATKSEGEVAIENVSSNGNFIIRHKNGARPYTVSKARLSKLNANINDLKKVNNIHKEFRSIIGGSNASAYWAVLNKLHNEQNGFSKTDINTNVSENEKVEIIASLRNEDFKNIKAKPYVLIIDEINRGNVSQIFGELITLIEKDKRLGNDEALEVKLPYSKTDFGVPPNLHIIGTMNTADRSIEALDTALRRRFTFQEMPSRPELTKKVGLSGKVGGVIKLENGIDIVLEDLLNVINNRIEKLIDKDHKIGHSYFLKVNDEKSLIIAFKNKIIPLLEEYFFGDYGKIGLVLGDSFIDIADDDFAFASFKHYDSDVKDDLKERSVFKIENESKWKFDKI